MKPSQFISILLSTVFYTNLVWTMVFIPLIGAVRYDAGMPLVAREARMWERVLDAPANGQPRRDSRLPKTGDPVPGPGAKQTPMDKFIPDAAMIKPVKARGKSIRL